MTSSAVVLGLAVFLASSVEMVEALTIVVAAGVSRGWRSALEGTGAALGVLVVLVAALGPLLVQVPIDALRAVVGSILLVFGLQWLRKAVLRASGRKAAHDEDVIYARHVAEMSGTPRHQRGRDPVGFAVAFKGVFLEGLEVVIVVLTLGATDHNLGLAALAAAAAVVVVGAIGVVVARQLSAVPENAMKMGVGLMLVSFGTFWSGEGLGAHWPGSDLAIPVLVGVYGVVAWALVTVLGRATVADRARVG
ncbi:MAG: COG4280 domain-containing protein [Acidimicrobiales bacterium]